VVVCFGGGFEVEGVGGLEDFEAFGVGAELDVMLGEGFGEDGEESFGDGGIDEQGLQTPGRWTLALTATASAMLGSAWRSM
jgi:hypothetical protein